MKNIQFQVVMGQARFFLYLLCIIAVGCKPKTEEDSGLPLPVQTLAPQLAANTFQYLGSVEGIEEVEIRSQVDGILEDGPTPIAPAQDMVHRTLVFQPDLACHGAK